MQKPHDYCAVSLRVAQRQDSESARMELISGITEKIKASKEEQNVVKLKTAYANQRFDWEGGQCTRRAQSRRLLEWSNHLLEEEKVYK